MSARVIVNVSGSVVSERESRTLYGPEPIERNLRKQLLIRMSARDIVSVSANAVVSNHSSIPVSSGGNNIGI